MTLPAAANRQHFLRPLQRRSRPDTVVAELADLGRLPRSSVLRRARDKDPARRLTRETLVSLARTFHSEGDSEAAGVALEALIARISGALGGKLRGWSVAPSDREDLQRHVLAGLVGFWLSGSTGEELWECSFATAFKFRTITLVQGFLTHVLRAQSLQQGADDEGEGLAEQDIPDPAAEAAFADLWRHQPERAALQALAAHNIVWSRVLHDKYSGSTEAEIAAQFDVSSRTIRNWITQARQFLLAYANTLD